jgi:hypothetical protein
VRYLDNATSSSGDCKTSSRKWFSVGTALEKMMMGRTNKNESVFREYASGKSMKRKLELFTFDDAEAPIVKPRGKREKRKHAPISRDGKRLLKQSAKDLDTAEQGGFLIDMGSEEGKDSSLSKETLPRAPREWGSGQAPREWGAPVHPRDRLTWGALLRALVSTREWGAPVHPRDGPT